MTWAALAIGCAGVGALTWLIWWGVRHAGNRGEERGELSEQAKALAEAENRRQKAVERRAQELPRGARLAALARKYRERRLRALEDAKSR